MNAEEWILFKIRIDFLANDTEQQFAFRYNITGWIFDDCP